MLNCSKPRSASVLLCAITATALHLHLQVASGQEDLPKTIDLRETYRQYQLDVPSQGGRGTCSTFTVTGALEYAVAKHNGVPTRLSVEFLNWASNAAIGETEDGGFFSDLWKGFEKFGICPDGDAPYRDTFDAKYSPSQPARDHAAAIRDLGLRMHWIKPWDPHRGLDETEFAAVKRAISQRWPVCGGFLWPKVEKWQDGLLQMAARDAVRDGHSVLLVGYEDDAKLPGGGRFFLRNTSHRGECSMSYEFARAYMNDALWIDFETARAEKSQSGSSSTPHSMLFSDLRGRNRRVSSNQQPQWNTENLDMNWLFPGQSVEVPVLQGPGVITHMWFTSHSGWVSELNSLTLRVYWDDRKTPGIEVPLGDFFAVGQGKPASVESVPVQVSPTGALTCFWRMPFQKAARIVITNDNPDRSTGLYWQIDWLQLDSLPSDTPYFHAHYRCEYPAVPGRDYLIADLAGRGRYVGTVMSVTLAQDGWFGEGDDFFFIDGEEVPSLQGTGSEDYFNDAWGFRIRTGPWFGQPRIQGEAAGDSGVFYRWHVLDPVNFDKSLRVAIEHKGNRNESEDGFFLERPDFFSSVALWYQTGEPKQWEPIPAWHQRRVPWQSQHLVRAFRQAETTGAEKPVVQTTGFFGARPSLLWSPKNASDVLTLPFETNESGRYAIRLIAASGPTCGTYDIAIDGAKVATAELKMKEEAEADVLLGTHALEKGPHKLSFQPVAVGASPAPLAVEMLRLLPLPPEATRTTRTHHEAHFIRLGIGRAVYAYRLAFGDLPDSLDTLVKSGIMAPRYRNDENNSPLDSHREGDTFFVESHGPEPWKHQWQGLDARR